jgi:hypothetical protein
MIQDIFADSRFLRPEALQALVAALIAAPGPLPRPPPLPPGRPEAGAAAAAEQQQQQQQRGGGGSSGEAGGRQQHVDWAAAELCLDLLMVRALNPQLDVREQTNPTCLSANHTYTYRPQPTASNRHRN